MPVIFYVFVERYPVTTVKSTIYVSTFLCLDLTKVFWGGIMKVEEEAEDDQNQA